MDYLDTLTYKGGRVVDSTGYPQSELFIVKTNPSNDFDKNVSSSDAIFGNGSVKLHILDSDASNPVIKPVTDGGGNASLSISSEASAPVTLAENNTNCLNIKTENGDYGDITLSAESNSSAIIDFTLNPKSGDTYIRNSGSSSSYTKISSGSTTNTILCQAASAPNYTLSAQGTGGKIRFQNSGTDSLLFAPGNGDNSIEVESAQAAADIVITPKNLGFTKTTKCVSISGSVPQSGMNEIQLRVENTTSGNTCNVITRANGNAPYLSYNMDGIGSKSIGMEYDGEIKIKDNWRYDSGNTIFSWLPNGRMITPRTFQSGSVGGSYTGTVTFPVAFDVTPIVTATIDGSNTANVFIPRIFNVTSTSFQYEKAYQNNAGGAWNGAASETLYWTAINPTQ